MAATYALALTCVHASIFLLALCAAAQADVAPTVRTKEGAVQGLSRQVSGVDVDSYLGIPFARPPVKDLRFLPPVSPAEPWTGVRNATYYRDSCIQNMDDQSVPRSASEDCLYLNVFVPRNGTSDTASKIPVLFWIYGGSFHSGSATLYNGEQLAALGQIIVVTTNYRLGALGFLATPTGGDAVANAGMLDQQTAMKWVQENIEAFGGDRQQVTIAGESAGAGSVSLHLLAPRSRNLFRRAISESGSSTARWAAKTREFGADVALALGKQLGCADASPDWKEVLTCLRSKNASDILDVQNAVERQYSAMSEGLAFCPVIDGSFLPRAPLDMLRGGDFKKTEYMSGVNRDEYSLFLLPYAGVYIQTEPNGEASVNSSISHEFFKRMINKGIMAGVPRANPSMLETAVYEYTDWSNASSDVVRLQQLIAAGSDISFYCPLTIVAQSWSSPANVEQGAKLFVYKFSHYSGIFPPWAGVPHAAELLYLFGLPLSLASFPKEKIGTPPKSPGVYTFTAEDKRVSEQVIALWSSFVKTGNPAGGETDLSGDVSWPSYTLQSPHYLEISDSLQLHEGLRPRQCAFWTKVMPLLAEHCQNSTGPTVATPMTPTSTCMTATAGPLRSSSGNKWKHATIAVLVIAVVIIIILVGALAQQKAKFRDINLDGREKLLQ